MFRRLVTLRCLVPAIRASALVQNAEINNGRATIDKFSLQMTRSFHIGSSQLAPAEKIPSLVAKKMTNEEWAKRLDQDQYFVTREHGTEAPFTGKYYNHKAEGLYVCSNCATDLFSSKTKYDSGSGWPTFTEPVAPIETEGMSHGVYRRSDVSGGMVRTEILCKNCNAHLGHVFNDGPKPSGDRYVINSASLKFQPKKLD